MVLEEGCCYIRTAYSEVDTWTLNPKLEETLNPKTTKPYQEGSYNALP